MIRSFYHNIYPVSSGMRNPKNRINSLRLSRMACPDTDVPILCASSWQRIHNGTRFSNSIHVLGRLDRGTNSCTQDAGVTQQFTQKQVSLTEYKSNITLLSSLCILSGGISPQLFQVSRQIAHVLPMKRIDHHTHSGGLWK